jgi:hypothetical protein
VAEVGIDVFPVGEERAHGLRERFERRLVVGGLAEP